MKYNAQYFAKDFPEWKYKKDSLMGKLLYRRLSFYLSAFFANMGFTANEVSNLSTIIAIVACLSFVMGDYIYGIIGSLLLNFWAILDNVDGNIARSVNKQFFGEFVDAVSSYILMALLGICVSLYVYYNGGFFVEKYDYRVFIIGALASNSDSLMRLVYQKYRNECYNQNINVETSSKSSSLFNYLKEILWSVLGFNENTSLAMLIATYYNTLDLMLIYFFVIGFFPCLIISTHLIYKTCSYSSK